MNPIAFQGAGTRQPISHGFEDLIYLSFGQFLPNDGVPLSMRHILILLAAVLVAGCQTLTEPLFPSEATESLAHFEHEAPAVGEPAPDFVLFDTNGNVVRLARRLGERPIVLIFGSYS